MMKKQHECLLHQLEYVSCRMREKKQMEYANKLQDLMRKVFYQEFSIAFCGHFSAGKSSMMNELFGEQILPTSPIPTSANVVEIRNGANQVTLVLTSGERYTFAGSYIDEDLRELCKNGEDIVAVEISKESISLPKGVSLLDTPGVDSTDDAHRIATESTLHMADFILFMMDYNHVQSEGNLQFLKGLAERNKKIYIVINQIDKHRDQELSFENYQQSVKQTFENWDLQVEGIYYTSLRDLDHEHNELDSLKSDLHKWIEHRAELGIHVVEAEAMYLMEQYLGQLVDDKQEECIEWQRIIKDSGVSIDEVEAKIQQCRDRQSELSHRLEEMELSFVKGIDEICKNAYLMPSEVRELGRKYLESLQPNFKVGFLFSVGKTVQEKKLRADTFFMKLKETVHTQLELHIRNYIIQFCKQQGLFDEQIGQQVMTEKLEWNQSLLEDAYKEGTDLTGNAVLIYTEDVANQMKRLMRNQSLRWQNELIRPRLQHQIKTEQDQINKEAISLQRVEKAKVVLDQIDLEFTRERALLEELWFKPDLEETLDLSWIEEDQKQGMSNVSSSIDLLWQKLMKEDVATISQEAKPVANESHKEECTIPSKSISFTNSSERNRLFLQHVSEIAESLQGIRGVQTVVAEIHRKCERAEKKQFTVALFGAFSAGKSSFANALMGDEILPVSPRPMTATINQICPPDDQNAHGQVLLKVKSAETLLAELTAIYRLFHKEALHLDQAIRMIPLLLEIKNMTPSQKTVIPFLQALQEGIEWFTLHQGSEIQISFKQMEEYVANEKKSCFIEYANLYYDGPLTRQGITLVDTPGADSVHSRHTGVAFDYIRNADVILFVTYYNHAFSKADREFLIQLGRVKDSFAMDKMFFITNAADLARSQDELTEVQTYLQHQLLKFGIREPRMFAISSLWGLSEKSKEQSELPAHAFLKDSGFIPFEQAFAQFVHHDLMNLSLHSIYQDVKRALQMTKQIIQTTQIGMEEKKSRQVELEKERVQVQQFIAHYETGTDQQALQQEIHELFYYVQKRWLLRFQDEFQAIFHPGSLREDLGDIKGQLHTCLLEMIQFLQHDLLQEYRATTLRMEKWMRIRLEQQVRDLGEKMLTYPAGFQWSTEIPSSFAIPELTGVMENVSVSDFRKQLAYYRNAKAFFEKKERFQMRDSMKQRLEEIVIPEITEMEEKCRTHFQQTWQGEFQRIQAIASKQSTEYYQELESMLSEHVDLRHYQQTEVVLEEFVEQWNEVF
ncbi:dynamin family protein [Thermoactinomyces sp. DSM 45892]|uniref:dynamin family protein n=1 Tax=Thermoactinomyces sp. DSM 45892 TaxID=1882753 RepID=UPI00089B2609|nr:dynamin family protein [Thermoactinomyces sp. DSM 45892]SDY62374.1 Dynamin family protein [Thermoactinomyces sp. DSM 45892]